MRALWIAIALGWSAVSSALEVEGVALPERVEVAGQALQLNGAGVRTKFFFDIYVGSLYLPQPAHTAEAALAMPGPKRVRMDFLYRKVPRDKIVQGWEEGFRRNQPPNQLARLRARLDAFNALFGDMKRGDTVVLDLIPGEGVRVVINGKLRGVIPGDDFARALLAVWLGPHPADADLKRAMLGK